MFKMFKVFKEVRGKIDNPIRLQLLRHAKVSKETNKMFNNSLGMYTSNWDGLRLPRSDIHDGKEVLVSR